MKLRPAAAQLATTNSAVRLSEGSTIEDSLLTPYIQGLMCKGYTHVRPEVLAGFYAAIFLSSTATSEQAELINGQRLRPPRLPR